MFDFFKNPAVTLSVHITLAFVVLIVLFNIIHEWKRNKRAEFFCFMFWVAFYGIYLILISIATVVKFMIGDIPASFIMYAADVSTVIAYTFFGEWIMNIGKTAVKIPKVVRWFSRVYCVVCFAVLTQYWFRFGNDNAYLIMLIGFFVFISFVCIKCRKAFGKFDTTMLIVFLVIVLATGFGDNGYTPQNFATTMCLLAIYFRLWQGRMARMIDTERDFAVLKSQLTESRMETALSQIQPHFIYNTLSTVSVLCDINPKKAQKVTEEFSDYLRYNLNLSRMNMLTDFSEELRHTMTYLDIEKTRFGEYLNVEYKIAFSKFQIPSLSLQPIVENAVKHGITQKKSGGTVTISTELVGDDVVVTVSDDGIGFDVKKSKINESYGIRCTRDRVEGICGGSLEIESRVGEGTIVKIVIPFRNYTEYK